MAKNRYRSRGRHLHMNVSNINGSGPGNLCKSGDPGKIGTLPVVCTTDEDANGEASVDTLGVYKFDVVNGSGGALGPGTDVNWDNTAGALNVGGAGTKFGVVAGKVAIPDGQTVEVEVRVGLA